MLSEHLFSTSLLKPSGPDADLLLVAFFTFSSVISIVLLVGMLSLYTSSSGNGPSGSSMRLIVAKC